MAPVPAKYEEYSYSGYETMQVIFDCLDGTQDRENSVKRVREDIPLPGICASLKLLTMGSTISEKDQDRLGLITLTAEEINSGFYFKKNLKNKDRRPKDNNVKTLNYARGLLDNVIQADVRRTLGDKEQLKIYDGIHKSGSLVKMDDSSRKLVLLLKKNEITSGAHVDFYGE
ncbi:hypothetical protein BGZ83_003370 [Gryganskiella cystojenkinii]|nr:hypothetical protein BGZ83_003370 [Gryganskiella cystojenkinii]